MRPGRLVAISIICLCAEIRLPGQISVTTANYDNRRTNSNPNETILTRAAVGGGSFGKLGSLTVDGQIYAQPLYAAGVQIAGRGVKNVVFAVTMNNSVYAFDADVPAASSPLWQMNLGTPVPGASLPEFVDIPMYIGILSTPVIDLGAQAIYVVSETFENNVPVFRLHALSLADGHEMANGPVVITASAMGSGAAAVNGVIQFDPMWHLQRPSLALANGKVYIAFGSHGDTGNYHGWVLAYNASNLQPVAVFNTTPNGLGGGIWQSGRAPAIDDAGNVYVVSGNGDFDAATNLSGAVIKLSGSDLSLLDWYTPAEWKYLDDNDLDVGSTGAILVPGANFLVAGDKGGRVISLNVGSLGHVEGSPGTSDFKASSTGIFDLSLWQSDQGPLLYQHDWHGVLKAYPLNDTAALPTPVSQGTWNSDSLYQGMAVSSNGTSDGIVWETTGDHSQPGVPGTLHAWNASDLTQELWDSDMQPGDALGSFAKFVSPLIANGFVYVPTLSNQLVVYGLSTTGGGALAGPQIVSILNGASFIQGVVSPGELLAIEGTNLGPSDLESMQVDNTGRVPTSLSGTQVFFDGVSVPLLYTSANQVGVIVPFGVTGPATQVVLQSNGQQSAPISVAVAAATPALFSASGLGSGQGAILNQDGTVNSSTNPASLGTMVSLFGTGFGQTTPPGQDGLITNDVLPTPNLPVSVWIGGVPATVTYAGAAPTMVEGVFQVNVTVPLRAPVGSNILVILQVGTAFSPSNTWLATQ
ncbi:MAG TPA: hypothetical protein VKR43_12430 [Bryobacteraceae bacterium]|nr:hypothetical protein [Bryobacteraceae bacterium]